MSVLSYLEEIAKNALFDDEEIESIEISIDSLTSKLDGYFGEDIESCEQFGSSTRGTILPRSMDDNSDIDLMIVFKDSSYKPQTYIDQLKKFVQGSYPKSKIYQSKPCVVLELNHIKFDLVPAINRKSLFFNDELRIPNNSDGWQITDPNGFNTTLTKKNKSHGSLVKPAIRLIKYWNADNGYIFESFLLENMIVNHNFNFTFITNKNLKVYFFKIIKDVLIRGRNLSKANKKRISRARQIVSEIEQCEYRKDYDKAEDYIKELIPY
jgi:hypothetical protein